MPDNFVYNEIGDQLTEMYPDRIHEYFYAQKYDKGGAGHPFSSALPLTNEFFGPRNLTLLIVSRAYDMQPEIMEALKARIKLIYPLWAKYKVLVWVDKVLAHRLADEDDTSLLDALNLMIPKIVDFCDAMQDYGFTYMGQLVEGKDANFFKPYIDDFYADNG